MNSCKQCKALTQTSKEAICKLGFPIDQTQCTPKELCPRPLTYLALIEARGS